MAWLNGQIESVTLTSAHTQLIPLSMAYLADLQAKGSMCPFAVVVGGKAVGLSAWAHLKYQLAR